MFSCKSTSCTPTYTLTIHTALTTEVPWRLSSWDIHFTFSDALPLGSRLPGAISVHCVLLNARPFAMPLHILCLFKTCVISRLPSPCYSCSSNSKDIPVPQHNPKCVGVTGVWAFLAIAVTNRNMPQTIPPSPFSLEDTHLDDAKHHIWCCLSLVCLAAWTLDLKTTAAAWWPCWFGPLAYVAACVILLSSS